MSIQKRISDEDVRKLVLARLRSFPSGRRISIGSEGQFNKEELIDRVKKDDRVGKKIIQVQLTFLRALKNQRFIEE